MELDETPCDTVHSHHNTHRPGSWGRCTERCCKPPREIAQRVRKSGESSSRREANQLQKPFELHPPLPEHVDPAVQYRHVGTARDKSDFRSHRQVHRKRSGNARMRSLTGKAVIGAVFAVRALRLLVALAASGASRRACRNGGAIVRTEPTEKSGTASVEAKLYRGCCRCWVRTGRGCQHSLARANTHV
jgi:hypothetical protein